MTGKPDGAGKVYLATLIGALVGLALILTGVIAGQQLMLIFGVGVACLSGGIALGGALIEAVFATEKNK